MRAPLVLVPGIDGSGLMYHRQVPRLERRFAVTTVRLRDGAARMTELVDDLHRAVSAAAPGEEPVTLVGESFGGALAMSYALAHPARVGRLVILNSFACVESRGRLWLARQLLRATPWSVMPLVRELNAWRMYSPQTGRAEIRIANGLLRASTRQGTDRASASCATMICGRTCAISQRPCCSLPRTATRSSHRSLRRG